jgi:hypothetical protein
MRPGSAPIQRKNHDSTSHVNHNKNIQQQKSQSHGHQHQKNKQPSFGNLNYFLNDQNFVSKRNSSSSKDLSRSDGSLDEISSKPSSKFSSKPDFDLNFSSRGGHRMTTVNNANIGNLNKTRHVNCFLFFYRIKSSSPLSRIYFFRIKRKHSSIKSQISPKHPKMKNYVIQKFGLHFELKISIPQDKSTSRHLYLPSSLSLISSPRPLTLLVFVI